MGVRDDEIKRLTKYAQGLGLKVVHQRYRRGDPGATYCHSSQLIELFYWPGQTKTRTILNFLHELGHHMDWVHNLDRSPDIPVLEDALIREDLRTPYVDPHIPKSRRKMIYDMECRGIAYMSVIAKELGIKLPMWKIKAEQEYDRWIYYRYYQSGDAPRCKECDIKRKELYSKHRSKVEQ